MVNDLLALFEKAYGQYGDKMILDVYKPKEGLYLKVSSENDSIEKLVINSSTPVNDSLYQWFKNMDYYSVLIDMNKPVDPKKQIHSNNYYTLFIKKDVFPGVGESDKVLGKGEFVELVKNYFEILKDPKKKYSDNNTLELYNSLDPFTDPDVDAYRDCIINRLDSITEIIKKEEFKNYIKIFFDKDKESYISESKKYFVPKIFNNNNFNVKIGNLIYGLSNNNMGLNSKKPYLELKGTRYKVPYRIDLQSALMGKKIFDWLNYQDRTEMLIPVDFNFIGLPKPEELNGRPCYYIHITRGTTVTIDEFEFIPAFNYKIEFEIPNYLQVEKIENGNAFIIDDNYLSNLDELENEVDVHFFNKRLRRGYYDEPTVKGNEFSKKMQNLLMISRKAFHSYFRKSLDTDIKAIVDYISREIVKEKILCSEKMFFRNAAVALNLRISLLKYFMGGEYEMGDKILPLMEEIESKAFSKDETVVCKSDEEFYFACGQLAYYMLSQSKTDNKTHSLVEPFLRAKTATELKRNLRNVFDTYKHALKFDSNRFNSVMGMVQGYDTQGRFKDYEDLFLAGFLAKNIFYKKLKEE